VSEATGSSGTAGRIVAHIIELLDPKGPELPAWVRDEDLTFSQLRLLLWLSRMGPASISGVAQWLDVGMATATGVVDRLVRHGLVSRRHRADDRRVVDCFLTERGAGLVTEIEGTRVEEMKGMLALLDQSELEQLERLFSLMVTRMREKPRAGP
jgi:DNA-binding MarR family transcriptional regulator